MSPEERKIYDLVVRRFLSVLFPPCIYEETSVTAEIGGETFTAKGKRIVENGWRELYETEGGSSGDSREEEETASEPDVGDRICRCLRKDRNFRGPE